MNEQYVYYYRFEGEPIGRVSSALPYVTHVCRVLWLDSFGNEKELLGLASSEASAKRTGKNLITRNEERMVGVNEYGPIEVISVGNEPSPALKGIDRFVKLLWKPKGMPKVWDKALHFKGRYLVTGEGRGCFYIIVARQEYKMGNVTGEIIWKDAEGKRVTGGPIFLKDF